MHAGTLVKKSAGTYVYNGLVIFVYPDSNALNRNPYLTGWRAEEVLEELKLVGGQLVFSPVVIGELKRQEMDDIDGLGDAIRQHTGKRTRGNPQKMTDIEEKFAIQLDEARAQVESHFDTTLGHPQVIEAAFPSHTSQDLVQKELLRKRPFLEVEVGGKKHTIGHRDAVIWEGVREAARDANAGDVIIFVSDDRGFSEGDNSTLHSDLIDDLNRDGVLEGTVLLVPSLEHARIKLRELREAITREQSSVAAAFTTLVLALEGEAAGMTYDPREGGDVETDYPLGLPSAFLDGRIVAVDLEGESELRGTGPYQISQLADLSVSGDMQLSDWFDEESHGDFEVWSAINDHFVDVSATRQVRLEAEFVVDDDGAATMRGDLSVSLEER